MITNTFSLLNLKCWPRFHQTSLFYSPLTCFSPPEVSKTGQAGCFKIEVAKSIQSKRKKLFDVSSQNYEKTVTVQLGLDKKVSSQRKKDMSTQNDKKKSLFI